LVSTKAFSLYDEAMTNPYKIAAAHLSKADPVMDRLIRQWGICTIVPHTDYYQALVSSIIGQQLSVKAAGTIKHRFMGLYDGNLPTPEQIVATDPETMREVGLSYAKARYVRDLAQKILDGEVVLDELPQLSNEEIVAELTTVKGIGEWTVHMFLMFCLGRMDVLPVGDLGVRMGIQKLYGLDQLPTPVEVRETAAARDWAPYESVASWYVWRSLDNAPD
jgi:DNA-3-methyladenine glycosylase II